MKTIRFSLITAALAVGLTFSLSKCKKEPPIVVHTYSISGVCTYPDYTNAMVIAKGATLKLYVGTDPAVLATTFSDSIGGYNFAGLLPGSYVIKADYNTDNTNKSVYLDGVNFVSASVNVTLGTSNATQNIALATVAAAGTTKISIDTITAGPSFRKVGLESHSKVSFEGMHNQTQQELAGGFNVFKFKKFDFDEATPANIVINAWVQTSSINTFEPSRDAIGTGCVPRTLNCDTTKVGGVIAVIPATDTIRFYANAGEVIKYGKGYLAHGHMVGFYKHQYGIVGPGGWSSQGGKIPADTSYLQAADGIPYNTTIDKPVDMYFEYISKIKQGTTSYQWMFTFEGTFTINKLTGWYVKSTSVSDIIDVHPHVTMAGTANKPY